MKKKVVITGGKGKFAGAINEINKKYELILPNKRQLNILNFESIMRFLKNKKPDYLIHSAALTNPMSQHKTKIIDSIDLNIIGTANVVKACHINNIKMVYISTNFVYPGQKGNYTENDDLNPVNKYGWSKLGGECSVKILKNYLILRICMTEDLYPHKTAFYNYYTSFLTKTDSAKIILKLLNKKGVFNIGGIKQSAYNYAKKLNPNIKMGEMKKNMINLIGKDTSVSIKKLKKVIKK